MSRTILIIFLCVLSAFPVMSNPRWKMHTTFDGEVDHVFETPKYVYFTSRAIPDMNGQRRMSLFRYDKEGDEIQSLSTDNEMSSNTVSLVQYCPQKGYVVAINTNFDITFLYDDGKSVTMPDYRLASINEGKAVNSITIDPWHDRIYLATNFGYVAINDEKYEIAESRNYGEAFKSVARVGSYIVILKNSDLQYARFDSARFSLADYERFPYEKPSSMIPLSGEECLVLSTTGGGSQISSISDVAGELSSKALCSGVYYSMSYNKNGLVVISKGSLIQINQKGDIETFACPELDHSLATASYDMSEIWQGKERKGLRSFRFNRDSSAVTITRDYMIPDGPSPFTTSIMSAHPNSGAMVLTYPQDHSFGEFPIAPLLVSGYHNGRWTNYSPVYLNEDRGSILKSPNGIAVDPDNPDYVYITSRQNGILRLNLKDADDILHMSKPSDEDNGNPGFVEFVGNKYHCHFSSPSFDRDGNLWTIHGDMDNQNPSRVHLYCWEAADRRAATSSANIVLPKKIEVYCEYSEDYKSILLALTHSKNKNLLVISSGVYAGDIILVDTKGTPTDASDDVVSVVKEFIDQDGVSIDTHRFRSFWEDPSTGYVWVCSSTGVFYFNPGDLFKGGTPTMYRIKIARNDGTNLADRLLEGTIVMGMTADGEGRKWFATLGGGAVCTSSDGRTIEDEINTSNSPIPSDDVYGLTYVPENNSMLFSTSEGIAEYFLSGEGGASGDGDLKIYPNPVRPDYFGYVTIEGLPDSSIVKIVDASGNIVKEFGPVSGDVQWDVTNHQFRRVSSGVYFVLASAGMNENAFSTVGKILVVN